MNSWFADGKTIQIIVGTGTCGNASGAQATIAEFKKIVDEKGLKDVKIRSVGCMGLCSYEPVVEIVAPGMEKVIYGGVKADKAAAVVDSIASKTILKDMVVGGVSFTEDANASAIDNAVPSYNKQKRIVLRNCGVINPENLEEYVARDGYKALEKVLFEMTPETVIDELKKSGLRGRGGAGFPTGFKWEAGYKAVSKNGIKYVVCNADEGDPGAYMDRSTIEGDPHSILEAMTICGRTIGANKGFIYIRAEYPLAVHRLEVAMEQSRAKGFLGKNILGSGFDFDIEIRLGAGAFVCGEETALLRSIEGQRGMPTPKPPFPAQCGLWGEPTVINNVETWANIPVIINKGADWFAGIGTEDSHGTKVFALTGKVVNSGLVEVPMGTTLNEIIFDVGGGIKGGKKIKGAQTGGPSGGIISESELDTPIDFGSLIKLGSMMGSGGMIVMDEDDCVVDVSKFYMEFCVDESCGKCSPCRIGTRQMHMILDKISKGQGTMDDIQKLEDIGSAMRSCSLCALGQSAPNPTLSTIKKFRQEYIDHIENKKCVAGKCKDLLSFVVDPDTCIGCKLCLKKCPANAIEVNAAGEVKEGKKLPYVVIDQSKCIKCGACIDSCKFKAISKK
ncbi:MAG: NADH-quinone oxidoreductase subunit NuoF [Treponema sp.]|nr:NADH-quinone oxidoreductase subunit NuoF [Treponema sp.]